MIYLSISMFLLITFHLHTIYKEYEKIKNLKEVIKKNKKMTRFILIILFLYYIYMINYDFSQADLYGDIKPLLVWIFFGIVFLFIYLKDKFWK